MVTDATLAQPCRLLDWDSEFWGFPVASLHGSTLTAALVDAANAWCADRRVACVYFCATGVSAHTLALVATNGFRFVDVRVELSRSISGEVFAEAMPPDGEVRLATAADLPELREIAARAHRDTRFFKDDRFDAHRAADLYRAWVERGFERDLVFVCQSRRQSGRPCGYVTCELDAQKNEGRIGLIAVSSPETGRGWGSCLVRAALRWFATKKVDTVRVVTQATNVPAMRLYETAGFRTSDVSLWFHKWFDGNACTGVRK